METKAAEHALKIDPLSPPAVDSVESSGLESGFLADLTLKTVYADTNCSTERVADKLKLPMSVVEPILQHLYRKSSSRSAEWSDLKTIGIRFSTGVGIASSECST